jgi:endonuclease/exonuclease/phosphatase family metal-dependent hydrolase
MICLVLAAGLSPVTADEAAWVIPYEAATDYVGESCVAYGTVVAARTVGARCFLNFHEDYRRHLTVVIHRDHVGAFPQPPEEMYKGRKITVRGRISEYQGRPQMVVTRPEQITLVTGDFPSPRVRKPVTTAPARSTDVVTVATFNILNLFDAEDDPYRDDEGTPVKPRAEIEKVADTIRKLNADVVALQEVENRSYLERVVQVFLRDMGYDVVLFEGNDNRGIDVAVLSRLPVGPVTSHRHLRFLTEDGKPMAFNRDLLQVRIQPPGTSAFDVYVVHLKSKRGGEESVPVRMGEAKAVRRILDERLREDPKARFVLCGDFNDTLDSRPVQTILGAGPTALVNVAAEIPEAERISYNQEPYRSMIDFILCSPVVGGDFVKGSARILHGSVETIGSDHNPVVASFRLR